MEKNKKNCSCNQRTCTCTTENCSCAKDKCTCCLEESIVTITAEDLKDNIEHSANFTAVNVLTRDYYDDCHIKGSISVPLMQLKLIAKDWDKNRSIVVYCAQKSCPLSKKAYVVLREMGFKRIAAYEGGIKEWREKGFRTEGTCKMDYLSS